MVFEPLGGDNSYNLQHNEDDEENQISGRQGKLNTTQNSWVKKNKNKKKQDSQVSLCSTFCAGLV